MNRRLWWFVGGGLLVALVLAGVVSNFASASPDGLDATTLKGCTVDSNGTITGGTCMAQQAEDDKLNDGPLAGYRSTGLAGVVGVLLTFAVGGGFFWLVRRRSHAANVPGSDGPGGS